MARGDGARGLTHIGLGVFEKPDRPVPGMPLVSSIEERAMAVDCAGNLVVGGSFTGKIVIQGQILTAVPGAEEQIDVVHPTEDIFLVKFGPDGVRHWARRFGDERQQRIHDLVIQTDGTIVVGGANKGTLELGGEPIVSDHYVGLLAAFDPGGLLVWQRTYDSSYDVALLGMSIGPSDVMSVYGHAGGDTDFGGAPIVYVNDPTFIAQFEADGSHRWSGRFFHDKHEPYHVGTDAAGGGPDDVLLRASVPSPGAENSPRPFREDCASGNVLQAFRRHRLDVPRVRIRSSAGACRSEPRSSPPSP